MIASRIGLAVLAAIAAVLALVVALGGGRPHAIDRALVPGLDVDRITELRIARGGETTTLVRGAAGWARRDGSAQLAANPQALDALLSALRGGHWQRRVARAAGGTPGASLTVVAGPTTATLGVGAALPGASQTWLVRAGDAVLVDDWIARALVPDALALANRQPLAGLARAAHVTIEAPGQPVLELSAGRLGELRVDAGLLRALGQAAENLELVALTPAPPSAAPALTIRTEHGWLSGGSPCGGDGARIAVWTASEHGCVDAARWRELVARVDALRGPPDAIVERRPLPDKPARLVLPDHAVLDLARRATLDGRDADPDRARELVAALAAPAQPVALPHGAPTGSIIAGAVTIDLYDQVVARRGEPVALRPAREAWAAIARPSSAYRDPTRWIEDASTITAITVDGTTYRRGAVLGEWTGTRDAGLVEALAAAVATVRAPSGPPPARVEHHVEIAIAPPSGAPVTHHLELAHPTASGCAGRADGEPVQLPLAVCMAVAAAR